MMQKQSYDLTLLMNGLLMITTNTVSTTIKSSFIFEVSEWPILHQTSGKLRLAVSVTIISLTFAQPFSLKTSDD